MTIAVALARRPRFPLATTPTPVHDAARLRAALGGERKCPRILIKRDDLTGLGLGGNKARKLEFLVADACALGATMVVTTGAVQSNHARMTAAAACAAGLKCVLVLTAQSDRPPLEGNLLLDALYGATLRYVPTIDPMFAVGDDAPVVEEAVAEEAARGGRAYVIPVGGSSGIGAIGYVAGTLELTSQLEASEIRAARLYYASGSRGTQAGLTLGARLCRASYELYGIAVSGGEVEKVERACRIANEAAGLLGVNDRLTTADFVTDQGFIGEGYGIPTPAAVEALSLLARTEGILLDPTYTAKAMAGLIAHVRSGEIDPADTIVFLHTGGVPAVFTADFVRRYSTRAMSSSTVPSAE